ncbi:methyltransferase family protein [Kribbella sp. NPDC054772]
MAMAIAALALCATWLTVVFGWRSLDQRRRTGDTGFRRLTGRPGTAAWWAGRLFALALIAGLLAPLADLLGLPTIPGLQHTTIGILGGVVAVLGGVGTVVAQHAMGTTWRVGVDAHERTDLVSTGLFRLSRNPFFTFTAVAAAGLAAMTPNLVAIAALVTLITAIQLQVRVVEEPHLTRLHGTTYRNYAAAVGRFVPLLGRSGR